MHLHCSKPRRVVRAGVCLSILVTLLLGAGCASVDFKQFYFGDLFGSGSSTTQKPPEQLAVEGMQKMREKDYGDALEAFKQLKEHYPYSKYAILADLKIGDANFHKKEYTDAAIAYEEFARLHPRNEVNPYVLYQIGMCHFLSFSTVDRDQGETQKAMEAFQRVAQAFPESDYATRARKQLLECQKRIVAHEYFVGEFYCRRENFKSARDRLEKVVQAYPAAVDELGYRKSIENILTECDKGLSKGEKKPSVWTRMGF